jgi:uncharacterized protein (TIGR00255 family)
MTGYGTAEGIVGKGRLYIEVKTVNHRFCDINLKIPPRMGVLESYVRKYLQDKFSRGKIDVFIKEKTPLFGGIKLSVDIELAKRYQRNFKKLARSLRLPRDADFLEYVGLDKFVHMVETEGSYERLWRQIEVLLKKATNHVRIMQEREGSHLMRQQRKCIDTIAKLVARIRKESMRALRQNERRLRKRLIGARIKEADEQRLQMELALLGGKQDIDEELTRLESHISQCRELLRAKEPVGRRFDFLLQEMNREVNTIGSKAADATISRMVVDSKGQLEKLREQVQNIE